MLICRRTASGAGRCGGCGERFFSWWAKLLACLLPLIGVGLPPEPAPTQKPTPAVGPPAASTNASPSDGMVVERWLERTRLRPDDGRAWTQLGDALMQRSRERAGGTYYERAEAAYRRALDLDRKDPTALVGLAWVESSRHEFDAASRYAREALDLDPRLTEAHALLGDGAVERGDYEEAMDHYQTCLDIRPDLSSYARTAQLLWLLGDRPRAKLLMQKATAAGTPFAENRAWCRTALAMMYFQEGALIGAEQQLELARRESPKHPLVLEAMGRIKLARGDFQSSRELLEEAVAIAPRHAALASLADLARLTGERQELEEAVQRVLDFHAAQGHGHTHEITTNQVHRHGNVDLARFLADYDRDLNRAVLEAEAAYQTSKSIPVLDTLAWCYLKQGREAEAARLIRRALKHRTPDAGILFHAGLIFAQIGEREAARQMLSQALSLNPNFHPIFARVAVAQLQRLAPPVPSTPTVQTESPGH